MKIHSVIRKGADHPVHCEDFMVINNEGRYFVGAVFDGCSGGSESHFASSLFGKVFKQILEDGFSGDTIELRGKDFLRRFVKKLFEARVVLNLEEEDMLTTFMMLMYDKVHGEALTMTIGDGVIYCDGETKILENKRFEFSHPEKFMDMPDYISYDLSELGLDSTFFDVWFERHVDVNKYIDPNEISIATDGILTFNRPIEEIDIPQFLLEDNKWLNNKIMLSKKVNVLRTKYKTVHKDDISIIRLIPKYEDELK